MSVRTIEDMATLHLGDCLDVLRTMEDASVDAVVTDPPYGLAFMGKRWDYDVPSEEIWRECLRVLKPGGHLLAFAGTRTQHRMAVRIEDAGFEIRDMIAWVYGSGFPKSLHVSKAIDKMDASEEQQARRYRFTAWMRSTGVTARQIDEATSTNMGGHYTTAASQPAIMTREHLEQCRHFLGDVPEWIEREADIRSVESKNFAEREVVGQAYRVRRESVVQIAGCSEGDYDITAPATEAAREWAGWGTALKPALEPITVARKPLIGTVAQNVLAHGTGALNIDGCRVENDINGWGGGAAGGNTWNDDNCGLAKSGDARPVEGRWPANLIHDGSDEVVELLPDCKPATSRTKKPDRSFAPGTGNQAGSATLERDAVYGDSGSAARFFYCAKASKADRDEGLDGTRTVKYNIDRSMFSLIGDLSWKNVYTELVASLQRATSGQTVKWHIGESGESITGQCPSGFLSTTLTEISKITTSQIFSLLTPSLTSAFTLDAKLETENGGSLAANAESSSQSTPITISASRESVLGVDLVVSQMLSTISDAGNWRPAKNIHSTVKPTDLMRYLCRLVTPPGGTVLDPFMGSGSTGKAAILEGFRFIGIEREPDYLTIAEARIRAAIPEQHTLPLDTL
jgi:DNA modification methylase